MAAGKRTRAPVDVFRYLDYRAFLGAVYQAQKERGLSYRAFAKRAQVGAPNYLKLVIEGERNLSPELAERFATAAGLTDEAAQYFCCLVRFCQAKGAAERAAEHEHLLAFKRYRDAHRLDASHADYHRAWYVPAIRELVTSSDFVEDARWIARKLLPPIKTQEAKSALRTLLKLGLLARDAQGKLVQTSAIVSTGAETQGVHIARYHAEMMARAVAAIDVVPSGERDVSSLTVCVSDAGLLRLKRRMQELRRELLALAQAEPAHERTRVAQLNMQLFPLSQGTASARQTRATRERTDTEAADDDRK